QAVAAPHSRAGSSRAAPPASRTPRASQHGCTPRTPRYELTEGALGVVRRNACLRHEGSRRASLAPIGGRGLVLPKLPVPILQMILKARGAHRFTFRVVVGGLSVFYMRECCLRAYRQRGWRGSVFLLLLSTAAAQAQTTLPDINVIATTPLSG